MTMTQKLEIASASSQYDEVTSGNKLPDCHKIEHSCTGAEIPTSSSEDRDIISVEKPETDVATNLLSLECSCSSVYISQQLGGSKT